MKSVGLAGLSALACLALAAPAVAAKVAKVDLSQYLDGHPVVGDFRVYDRDDGQTLESRVIEVDELAKSTLVQVETTEAGNTSDETDEIVHGKELRVGSELELESGIDFLAKPKRIESFQFVPGVPQKARIGLQVTFQGRHVGNAALAAATTFVGFESSVPGTGAPPATDTPQIVHLHRDETLTVKIGHDVFKTVSSSDRWIDPTHGTQRVERSGQAFKNGVQTSTIGPFVYTFSHGQHDGVPYP
jgi:hypothetical protein